MPAERFYIDADLQGTLTLKDPEHHHLAHVMRVRIGEEVELVNGRGGLGLARVEAVTKHDAQLKVLTATQNPLPDPRLQLAVPLMRPAKMELVIEKCTELGADAFYLYPAQYSEKKDLSDHQLERLVHIAISAMKQCGRLDLPQVTQLPFEKILTLPGTFFFGDLQGKAGFEKTDGEIVFMTGPEKGFSEKELAVMRKTGTGVRLHKNILRAETAPIVATLIRPLA